MSPEHKKQLWIVLGILAAVVILWLIMRRGGATASSSGVQPGLGTGGSGAPVSSYGPVTYDIAPGTGGANLAPYMANDGSALPASAGCCGGCDGGLNLPTFYGGPLDQAAALVPPPTPSYHANPIVAAIASVFAPFSLTAPSQTANGYGYQTNPGFGSLLTG